MSSLPTTTAGCEWLLTAHDVRLRGLALLGVKFSPKASRSTLEKMFMKHYGSNSASLAEQWYDLCVAKDSNLKLEAHASRGGYQEVLLTNGGHTP